MAKTLSLKKDQILFLADEMKNDLYIIRKGKVMVFVQKGTQIIPVAYLDRGEYIGELSFFDDENSDQDLNEGGTHDHAASSLCSLMAFLDSWSSVDNHFEQMVRVQALLQFMIRD
jgi:CRP-like cAMP-binding protein